MTYTAHTGPPRSDCRGTGSDTIFPALASTAEGRDRFITSAIKYAKDHGFGGIDLDWEYPNYSGTSKLLLLFARSVHLGCLSSFHIGNVKAQPCITRTNQACLQLANT